MVGVEDRRDKARIADMVGHCPSDRRQHLLFKLMVDVEARRELTASEREAADAHLARVLSGGAG